MTIPAPFPGLVVRYAYLWYHEHRRGQEEGRKDRPAAILMATQSLSASTRVYVLPITHTEPESAECAIEVPRPVKRQIGLDAERSWIVLDEVNDFIWPGFDLTPIPGSDPPLYSYGVLPAAYFDQVKRRFLDLYDTRRIKRTARD